MKTIRTAVLIALVALMGLAGTASAHTATSSCEKIKVTRTPGNHPAYIYAEPQSDLVYGPVGNGTYAVPAGDYIVIWPAWDANGHKEGKGQNWTQLSVATCVTPTPSVTPSPTPTASPSPSPSATPTPTSSVSPTATPSASPTPTPTPTNSPPPSETPSPTTSVEPTAIPTLPPTDTSASDAGPDGRLAFLGAALVATLAGLYMLKHPHPRRRKSDKKD